MQQEIWWSKRMQFCTLKMWVCKQKAFQWHNLYPRLSRRPHVSSVVVESEKNVNHHHTFAVPVSIMMGWHLWNLVFALNLFLYVCVFITKTRGHSEKVSEQMQTFIAVTRSFWPLTCLPAWSTLKIFKTSLNTYWSDPSRQRLRSFFSDVNVTWKTSMKYFFGLLITSMLCSICINVHIYQYIFMSCCLFWLITLNSLCGVNFAFNSVYNAK